MLTEEMHAMQDCKVLGQSSQVCVVVQKPLMHCKVVGHVNIRVTTSDFLKHMTLTALVNWHGMKKCQLLHLAIQYQVLY